MLALSIALAMPACQRSRVETSEPPTTFRYAADGLAFSYPDTMTLERGRRDVPLRTVMVTSAHAFAMIGWTPRPVNTARLRERAYEFVCDRVLERSSIDSTRSGGKVLRTIGGRRTEGVAVYGTNGPVTLVGEVHAVELAGKSVMVLLFYPEDPAKRDLVMLDMVARTLGPDTDRAP